MTVNNVIQFILAEKEDYVRAMMFDIPFYITDVEIKVPKNNIAYEKYGIHKVYFRTIDSFDLYVDLRFLSTPNNISLKYHSENVYVISPGPVKWLENQNNYIEIETISDYVIFRTKLNGITLYIDNIYCSLESFYKFIKTGVEWKVLFIKIKDTESFNFLSQNKYKIKSFYKLKQIISLILKMCIEEELCIGYINLYITRNSIEKEKISLYEKRIKDILELLSSIIKDTDKNLHKKFNIYICEQSTDAYEKVADVHIVDVESLSNSYGLGYIFYYMYWS